jgi:hypothetical protein
LAVITACGGVQDFNRLIAGNDKLNGHVDIHWLVKPRRAWRGEDAAAREARRSLSRSGRGIWNADLLQNIMASNRLKPGLLFEI